MNSGGAEIGFPVSLNAAAWQQVNAPPKPNKLQTFMLQLRDVGVNAQSRESLCREAHVLWILETEKFKMYKNKVRTDMNL